MATTEAERKYAREYQRKRRAADPEGVRAKKRAYYQRHKEAVKAKVRDWYRKNVDAARKRARRKSLAKLGTTPEERASTLVAQGNRCAICGKRFKNTRSTHTDHDHSTGKFRALLCVGCNNGLGVVERQGGRWVISAIYYLVKHGNTDFSWVYEPKSEERQVHCERRMNYETGKVVDVRLDTGEVIEERDMSDAEKQRGLPFDQPDVDDEFGDDEDDSDDAEDKAAE